MKEVIKKAKLYIFFLFLFLIFYHFSIYYFQKSILNIYSAIGLIPIAFIYYVLIEKFRQSKELNYFIHLITYLLVNGSFWFHTFYLEFSQPNFIFNSTWKGALFGMSIFWGIGLILHTLDFIKKNLKIKDKLRIQ